MTLIVTLLLWTLAAVALGACLLGGWKAFAKAGLPGWGVLVPVYNVYLLCRLAVRPGWLAIPIVTPPIIAGLWICIAVAGALIALASGPLVPAAPAAATVADTQPAAPPPTTQPAETQPAETQPAGTQPAETPPAGTQPAGLPTVADATTQPTSQPAATQPTTAPAAATTAAAAAPVAPVIEKTHWQGLAGVVAGLGAWGWVAALMMLVPLFFLMLDVAQNFGKGAGFGLGLVVLAPICWPILGLGKARFRAPPPPLFFPPPFPPLSPLAADPILRVAHLHTYFPVRKGVQRRTIGYVRAVDDVSFDLPRGQTLGLVGESGCGKTTVARTILRLIPATHGRVAYDGTDLFSLDPARMRQMRRNLQVIFQDPVGSLNPRMTVGSIIGEPLKVHGVARGRELADRVARLMTRVGLSPDYARRYPHEFSGGQRQRIGIARALALEPKLIICDEPVSALDVSIQSQILNLLTDLQGELGLSYLFIAHNLAVIEHFCDVVAVMYFGKIVEIAAAEELYANPKHPYTIALMSAAPRPEPDRKRARIIPRGEVPSPLSPPTGCPYHPRCHLAKPQCAQQIPPLEAKQGQPGHLAACLLAR